MWNIARDPGHDLGFKAVHGVLAVVSLAFAVALLVIGLRMRREAVHSGGRPASSDPESRDRQRAVGG
jgi:hypothetical protein